MLAQELSMIVVPGRVTVDGGPVGHTGVTPQDVSVIVVAGDVGHAEVAGQLPVSTSVVVTVAVPVVGQVLGGQGASSADGCRNRPGNWAGAWSAGSSTGHDASDRSA